MSSLGVVGYVVIVTVTLLGPDYYLPEAESIAFESVSLIQMHKKWAIDDPHEREQGMTIENDANMKKACRLII